MLGLEGTTTGAPLAFDRLPGRAAGTETAETAETGTAGTDVTRTGAERRPGATGSAGPAWFKRIGLAN